MLIRHCLCGSDNADFHIAVEHYAMATCHDCGVLRVYNVPDTYLDQYRDGSYQRATTPARQARREHSYEHQFAHDLSVAASRLRSLLPWKRAGFLLDVGCNNGAVVQQARSAGFDARGTDLSLAVYQGPPHAAFSGGIAVSELEWRGTIDVITYYDVLEHCLDPIAELAYARALLAPGGVLVLELPDMAWPVAAKHIKPDEHLWYWTAAQLLAFLDVQHWHVHHLEHPIPGKMTVFASPQPATTAVRVYVPPGIGDIAWCLPKIAAIRAIHEPCTVTVQVSALSGSGLERRAEGYLALFPCVDAVNFDEQFPIAADFGQLMDGHAVYQLYPNARLEAGERLEGWHPQWKAPAVVPQFAPASATHWAEQYVASHHKPVVPLFCSSHQYYAEFQPHGGWQTIDWVRLMRCLQPQYAVVLVGSAWDRDYAESLLDACASGGGIFSLIGETSVAQLLALARVSAGVIGLASGVTILSTYAGVPTVALWPVGPVSSGTAVFTEGFQTAWVSRQQQQHYRALPLASTDPLSVVRAWRELTDSAPALREVV